MDQNMPHPYGTAQTPALQSFPPRHDYEVRLTAILERIERRLIALEKRFDDFDRNRQP